MATQTTERFLDDLAKGLASDTLSRGKAIRWMGGALLGAALASVPGVAWADDDCRRLGREGVLGNSLAGSCIIDARVTRRTYFSPPRSVAPNTRCCSVG